MDISLGKIFLIQVLNKRNRIGIICSESLYKFPDNVFIKYGDTYDDDFNDSDNATVMFFGNESDIEDFIVELKDREMFISVENIEDELLNMKYGDKLKSLITSIDIQNKIKEYLQNIPLLYITDICNSDDKEIKPLFDFIINKMI